MAPSDRWRSESSALIARAIRKAVVIMLGAALTVEVSIAAMVIALPGDIGVDFRFYRDTAARWLADGSFYLPHQLAGPYRVTTLVDVLYPPNSLFLFVPFVFVPAILWWAIPIGVIAYTIVTWRPGLWAVSAILLLLMFVRAFGAFLWGNTDMWMTAAVAAGLRWGWPAVLIALKPSVLPFAVVGIRHRSFWIVGAALGLASLALWPLWLDYVTVLRNLVAGPDYSLGSVTLLLVPIVAWLARRRPTEVPAPSAAS